MLHDYLTGAMQKIHEVDTFTLTGKEEFEELGKGGGGVVFKVHTLDRGVVVVKTIQDGKDDDVRDVIDDIANEIKVLKELSGHPNIVELKGMCMQPFGVVIQIAKGLSFIHDHNIIHRDLMPKNILVNQDLQVFISDFGMAHRMEDQNDLPTKLCGHYQW